MKINFQETTNDLATRIDIHNKFGSRDIDRWMLDTLNLQKGAAILDVGCGAGKQCFSFYNTLGGDGEITGGDVSADLLNQARRENQRLGARVAFTEVDFNRRFPFEDERFDLASCCFAIYYAEDIPFTIHEMHRVLKPGGCLFTTGPMPDNKRIFYDVIKAATGKPIPPMPGSSRYSSEILSTIQSTFSSTEVHLFENPLTFHEVGPFIDYTRASLSEDRKLWQGLFQGKDDFENVIAKITAEVQKRLATDGRLVMTKVVGGFLAVK
jgi:ubiquinone/menaquinone biosynthesis C-methylase UbiE